MTETLQDKKTRYMDALETAIVQKGAIVTVYAHIPPSEYDDVTIERLKTLDATISDLRSRIAQIELQEFREQKG